tara:strand:+ start:649 stop:1017 length:369 start_codon:yes stop_codon:yes gene_type:complete
MSEGKFMTKLYNPPTQNMNEEEQAAFSEGQNTGIKFGISMLPIGRAIGAVGGILSKAPALARTIRAFTNAPRKYMALATKGVKIGDKAKKVNAVKDLGISTPRTGEGNIHPLIINNKIIDKI